MLRCFSLGSRRDLVFRGETVANEASQFEDAAGDFQTICEVRQLGLFTGLPDAGYYDAALPTGAARMACEGVPWLAGEE